MKQSKLLAVAILLLLPITTPLNAADNASHKQQVDTLFRLTQMEKKINESVDTVLQLQLQQNPQLIEHDAEIRAFFEKYIGWQALKGELSDMYVQTFSEDELKAINAFYITPAGQKVITELPQLVQQRNMLAMQRIQQNIGELQQIVKLPVKQ